MTFKNLHKIKYTIGVTIILVCVVYLLVDMPKSLPFFDAENYYQYSKVVNVSTLLSNSIDFKLLEPIVYRGYFFPFVFGSLGLFVDNYYVSVVLYNSILLILSSFLFFRFCCKKNNESSLLLSSMVYMLFSLVYAGLLTQPLADISGLSFMLITISLFSVLIKRKSLVISFIFGLFLYITYNARSVYMYPIVILVVVYLVILIRNKDFKYFVLTFPCVIGGVLIASFPQMYINFKVLNVTFNPLLIEPSYYDSVGGLTLSQLKWGLTSQRYDTYVGTSSNIIRGGALERLFI